MDFNSNRFKSRSQFSLLALITAVVLFVLLVLILAFTDPTVKNFFNIMSEDLGLVVFSSTPALLLAGLAMVFLFRKGQFKE